jgi:hypothetical protein
MKKALLIGCVTLALFALAATVVFAVRGRSSTPHTAATLPQGKTQAQLAFERQEYQAAWSAANALKGLRWAVLAAPRNRRQTVDQTVFPRYRVAIRKQLTRQNKFHGHDAPLWSKWGFTSRLSAFLRADYKVAPVSYKVELPFDGKKANVLLYVKYKWTPADAGQPLQDVSIVVEVMRKLKGRWWFASERRPGPTQVPDLRGLPSDTTIQEKERLYRDYVKGFKEFPS